MRRSTAPVTSKDADFGVAEIQSNIQKLERSHMWVWGNAAIVILGLTALVVSLSVSLYLQGVKTFMGWDLRVAVRVLVGLVVVFTAHMIYQHLRLRRIQGELAEQQIQAEVFRRLAMYDPLTGLYNRRYAEQRLRAEIARSERRGLSMIVVLLDLNNFKEINDRHGHLVGDQVLKEFGYCLSRSTRGSDLAARWGGDEFIILLLDCEVDQLSLVLERIDGFEVEVQEKHLPISFAVGWKAYEVGDTFESILQEADKNLYTHKASVKAPEESITSPV